MSIIFAKETNGPSLTIPAPGSSQNRSIKLIKILLVERLTLNFGMMLEPAQ
jgi:hypothetical protein